MLTSYYSIDYLLEKIILVKFNFNLHSKKQYIGKESRLNALLLGSSQMIFMVRSNE